MHLEGSMSGLMQLSSAVSLPQLEELQATSGVEI
jgi:hypothetical protein